ncbi:hypothetical protein ABFX02_02G030500 [Erythranthe guttata]
MASLFSSELTLDCRFSSNSCYKETIGGISAQVSRSEALSEKISELVDYVNSLQDEMNKIGGFKRELPHCMRLLKEEIGKMKEEMAELEKCNAEPPVLEEFIPLKKISTDEKDDDKVEGNNKEKDVSSKEKMNWMSSVQLWNSDTNNQSPDTDFNTTNNNKLSLKPENKKKRKEEEVNRGVMDNSFQSGKIRTVGRAFVPFKRCANFPVMTVGKEDKNVLTVPKLSLCTPEIKNSMDAITSIGFIPKSSSSKLGSLSSTNVRSSLKSGQQQNSRKQRRCWSPELHRKFVNALQSLGGSQAATPKQIRDHMQVDGLTNDEVKSHLQKFRLHTRKATLKSGGMWMSQEQCGESSKQNNCQSGSPEGPLQLGGSSVGYSSEYEDDDKSESHTHLSVRDS